MGMMACPGAENPMPRLYFEDFVPGTVRTYGSYRLSRDELIAFATNYDPQPMHLDEAAAEKTLLGGLAASGWHTCAMLMRMIGVATTLVAAAVKIALIIASRAS